MRAFVRLRHGVLQEARRRAGLTQVGLAGRAGVGASDVSRLERGRGRELREQLLRALLAQYGELFRGDG
jgi:transcriptional regulator with XRE-family HTH domain